MDYTGYTKDWAVALFERDGGDLKGCATVREYVLAELGFMHPGDDELAQIVTQYEHLRRANSAPSDDAYERALDRMGDAGLPF